jgi:hypothetical protein
MKEAEIRKITVPGQPRPKKKKKKVCEIPISMSTCHPDDSRKHKTGVSQSRLAWAKSKTLYQKKKKKAVKG